MSINETPKKNKIWKGLNIFLVVMVLLGGMYFLKSIDDLMIKNLELEQLNNKVNLLKEERKEMELQKNYLESYENVNARLEGLNMVRIGSIDYISVSDESLAKR